MSNAQEDAVFVRNFSMVLAGLVVVGIICFILAKIVDGSFKSTQEGDRSASKRIMPAGTVNVGEPLMLAGSDTSTTTSSGTSKPISDDPGEATYGKICFSCHDLGIAGAPKLGDKAVWESRLQKGVEMVVSNAINGFQGETGIMPARGGLPNLSDDDVRASVMHMLASVGEGEKAAPEQATPAMATPAMEESAAPAASEPAMDEPTGVATGTAAASTSVAATPAEDGRGKEVYDAACFICHAAGVAGAPKLGDAESWAERTAKGMETLYEHSIKGFMGESGLMPPKGGRPDFSDADVNAAVDYMVNSSK